MDARIDEALATIAELEDENQALSEQIATLKNDNQRLADISIVLAIQVGKTLDGWDDMTMKQREAGVEYLIRLADQTIEEGEKHGNKTGKDTDRRFS